MPNSLAILDIALQSWRRAITHLKVLWLPISIVLILSVASTYSIDHTLLSALDGNRINMPLPLPFFFMLGLLAQVIQIAIAVQIYRSTIVEHEKRSWIAANGLTWLKIFLILQVIPPIVSMFILPLFLLGPLVFVFPYFPYLQLSLIYIVQGVLFAFFVARLAIVFPLIAREVPLFESVTKSIQTTKGHTMSLVLIFLATQIPTFALAKLIGLFLPLSSLGISTVLGTVIYASVTSVLYETFNPAPTAGASEPPNEVTL